MKRYRKVWGYMLIIVLLGILGCSDSSDNPTEASIEPQVLESAATFLGAATGKEVPITVEQVVFVNTVMGINNVERKPKCMYGDLWIIVRDEYGVPVLDENNCKQPIASEPIPIYDDQSGEIIGYRDTVPMIVEEYMQGESKCSVVEAYADYTQEVILERLNMVRSHVQNPDMLARAFEEAMKNINAAEHLEKDPAGRLVMVGSEEVIDPDTGEISLVTTRKTIDAPRENLALYYALLTEGRLAGYGVEKIGDEGQVIPAPWLEIRPDLDMGDLAILRDGTPGRSGGVDLHEDYADLSMTYHSTGLDYGGRDIDYVQYHEADDMGCIYSNATSDAWQRVFKGKSFEGVNIEAFAKHADDTRKMIGFIHRVIQDRPSDGTIPALAADLRVDDGSHDGIPEITPPEPIDPTPLRHLQLETAAAMMAAASGKEIPLSADSIMFVNTALGINDIDTSNRGEFFGDLWVILRDENGVPILDEQTQCVQPLPAEPIEVTVIDPDGQEVPVVLETVPMQLEEYMDGLYKCVVVPGFEDYVQEVKIGRLNCVRTALTNPSVLNKHLVEAVTTLNNSLAPIKRDLAGRLVYTTEKVNEVGETEIKEKAIDSPLQNLALYRALMVNGTLEGPVEVKQEGVMTVVDLSLDRDLLVNHGLEYLVDGNETSGPGQRVLPLMTNGYADFDGFSHAADADYSGVLVDYVQWHDPAEGGCVYTDVFADDIHTRVLGGDMAMKERMAAFLEHAEDAREVILFNHNVIQDRPEY